ncbi:class D sortase [Steroidobacter cummioxidans]|uniref:class D sortase n=1 Tax=Steroidobacter cummioxidans TaxID=1803913 RepID=UPI0019D4BC12|nr:class D sortase [Steroidobacter cummioxidans]
MLERACWALACLSIVLYLAARMDAAINGGADLANATATSVAATTTADVAPAAPAADSAAPTPSVSGLLGSLEIPSLGLRTPLYSDSSEVNLNRGAGLIAGMAGPGEGGNLGVAAHRDGTFRPLQNIRVGDAIEVRTANFHYVYRVTSITVVDRSDAALLRRTDEPVITLVTCYPFRFVGPAPRRFVVRGLLDATHEATAAMTPPPREKPAAI